VEMHFCQKDIGIQMALSNKMDYISNISKNLQQLIYIEIYKYRTNKLWKELTGLMTWIDGEKENNLTGWYYTYGDDSVLKIFQIDISERLLYCDGDGCIYVKKVFSYIGRMNYYGAIRPDKLPKRYWHSNGTSF